MNTPSETPLFNEAKLGEEICRVWGRHGAHAEVYGMLQARLEMSERDREIAEHDRARLMEALRGIDDLLSGSIPITAQVKAIISDVLK